MLKRVEQARHRAGHARRGAAIAGAVAVDIAASVDEHILRGGGRRGLPVVDGRDLLHAFKRDQHEAAPADIARLRVRHGEREAGCDGGVHRIAARLQDVRAHLRGYSLLGRNHPMLGDDRVKPRFGSDPTQRRRDRSPAAHKPARRGGERQQRGQGDKQGSSHACRMHL